MKKGERREQEHWVASESFVSADFSFSIRLPEEKMGLPRKNAEVYDLGRSQSESRRVTAVTE
jgi:hypothetical protein